MSTLQRPIVTSTTYTTHEVAELAGVSARTVSYWFRGRRGSGIEPLFELTDQWDPRTMRLSFLNLCEAMVVADFRRHGASLQRLRLAREFSKQQIGSDYPFATEQFKLAAGQILTEFSEQHPSNRRQDTLVDCGGENRQAVLPSCCSSTLERIDYTDMLGVCTAYRYHPYGREVPLVIEPGFGSGRLTVVDSSLLAESVWWRIEAGFTPWDLYDDLGLPFELSERLIQFKISA